MVKTFENFKEKTLREIRWWAWAAAVLPLTALAGLFFIWAIGDDSLYGYALALGETIMFAVAVTWWWWAMYVLRNLVRHWDQTGKKITDVKGDVKLIKELVRDIIDADRINKQ